MEVHPTQMNNSWYREEKRKKNITIIFRFIWTFPYFLSIFPSKDPNLIEKETDGLVLGSSSLQIPQTTPLTLSGQTVACLTELLSWQLNIHNWPNNRDEGVRKQLAVKSVDGHRPWLLSECEMPTPDCFPLHPEGSEKSQSALASRDGIKNNLTGLHLKTSPGPSGTARWSSGLPHSHAKQKQLLK